MITSLLLLLLLDYQITRYYYYSIFHPCQISLLDYQILQYYQTIIITRLLLLDYYSIFHYKPSMLGFPHGTPKIAGGSGLRPRAAGEVQRSRLPSEGPRGPRKGDFSAAKRGETGIFPSKMVTSTMKNQYLTMKNYENQGI